jgi:hypothetical protein
MPAIRRRLLRRAGGSGIGKKSGAYSRRDGNTGGILRICRKIFRNAGALSQRELRCRAPPRGDRLRLAGTPQWEQSHV